MSEAIVAYLQKKGAPATAEELVQAVLNISNASPQVAVKLIQSLLKEDGRVQKVAEDSWLYVARPSQEMTLSQQPFLLCKIEPQQAATWRQWQQVGFATVQGFQVISQRVFILNKPVAVKQLISFVRDLPNHYSQHILVLDGYGNQLSLLRRAIYESGGGEWEGPVLTLKRMVSFLQTIAPQNMQKSTAGQEMHLFTEGEITLLLRSMAEQLFACLQSLSMLKIETISQLFMALQASREPLDLKSYAFDQHFLATLPLSAGVYLMLDAEARVIYVGKSKNLHHRLNSYFRPIEDLDEKLTTIRSQLYDIRYILTGSDLEALLLEAELIKILHPPINRQVQIAYRRHRKKNRYEQIIILPSALVDVALALLLHPTQGLVRLPISLVVKTKRQPFYPEWPEILAEKSIGLFCYSEREAKEIIGEFFFAEPSSQLHGDKHLAEIAYSWISVHEQTVNSIDMRKIANVDECLRLLLDYIHHILQSSEKVVYK